MNIFVTSRDAHESAIVLDDSRVIKMALESAQLLSNALPESIAPYKRTHMNHPCSKWVQSSPLNYAWLLAHFVSLCEEYTRRFNRTHACRRFEALFYNSLPPLDPNVRHTLNFINCTPHKEIEVVDAYKITLLEKWSNSKRQPRWTNTAPPSWLTGGTL